MSTKYVLQDQKTNRIVTTARPVAQIQKLKDALEMTTDGQYKIIEFKEIDYAKPKTRNSNSERNFDSNSAARINNSNNNAESERKSASAESDSEGLFQNEEAK